MTEMHNRGVIRNVQALRAVAVLATVFFHLPSELAAWGVPAFGYGGVDMFFVISGFIMVHTTASRPVTPWSFMLNRIRRIVPLYWTITMAVLVVAVVAPTLLQATRVSGMDLLKSLLFVPFAKSNGEVQPMLFVGWSLNYEMFFYLLFALGLATPQRAMGVGAVIVVLVGLVGLGAVVAPSGVLAEFYTNPLMVEFALGMLIGLWSRHLPDRANRWEAMATMIAVGVALLAVMALPMRFPGAVSALICGGPAAVAVAGGVALERWGYRVRNRWVLLIGDTSYAIYLTHPFVTRATERLTTQHPSAIIAALLIVTAMAGILLLGAAVHYLMKQCLENMQTAGRLIRLPLR